MRRVTLLAPLLATLLLAGCGGDPSTAPPFETPRPSAPQGAGGRATPSAPQGAEDGATPSPSTTPTPTPGSVPPAWLGTRVLPVAANGFGEVRRTPSALRERAFTLPDTVAELPGRGFASRVVSPAPARVLARSTWDPACPVAAEDLSWVRVAFRGFDGARHTGELLVATRVADDVARVFERLWAADFPIEEMRVTRRDELDAPPTGDGNNTGAFVCRPVVGGSTYSQHAYGLAVDVNPFQNPYTKGDPDGDVVIPELASAYLDRGDRRPGMYDADSAVVRAFADIGWTWGGTWRTAQDRHHFSLTGG